MENEKINMEANVEYNSSWILLEMAKDEYTKERDRANSLDSKAGFFITAIIAVATIFVPIIPFSKIVSIFQIHDNCVQKCVSCIFLTGILLAFILLVVAFTTLYNCYKLKDYKRPNLDCIDIDNNHFASNGELNKKLSEHYKEVVDDNINVNNKKCDSINVGVKLCSIGFLILVVSSIGLIITIGG